MIGDRGSSANQTRPQRVREVHVWPFSWAMKRHRRVVLILSIVCFAAFSPALRVLYTPEFVAHYSPLITQQHVADCSWIRDEALRWGKLRPAASLVHMTLISLFGSSPVPYKSVHTVLHVLSGFLLFIMVANWTKRHTALQVALLFLLLPVRLHSESLVHVMSLDRLLSLNIVLASYLLWRKGGHTGKAGWFVVSGLTYMLALFFKESVLLIPMAFPFVYAFLEREPRLSLGQAILRCAAWIGSAAVMYAALRACLFSWLDYGVPAHIGTVSVGGVLGNLLRSGALLVGAADGGASVPVGILAWVGIVVLHCALCSWRTCVVGAVWMFAALGPHMHLNHMGYNFVYGALPWLCFVIVIAINALLERSHQRFRHIGHIWNILLVVLIVLCFRSTRILSIPWLLIHDIAHWAAHEPREESSFLLVQVTDPHNTSIRDDIQKGASPLRHLTLTPVERIRIRILPTGAKLRRSFHHGHTATIDWAAGFLPRNTRRGPEPTRAPRARGHRDETGHAES